MQNFRTMCPPRLLMLGMGEVFVIGACFLLATVLRLGSDAYFELNYRGGFTKIGVACAVCLFTLYFFDFYDFRLYANHRELLIRAPQVIGTAMIALGLLYYLYPRIGLGRGIFAIGVFLLLFGLIGYRAAFLLASRRLFVGENTILLGEGRLACALAQNIEERPEMGLRLVGFVSDNGRAPASNSLGGGPAVLGTSADLARLVAEYDIQRLIVAADDRRGHLPLDQLMHLKAQGVTVEEGLGLYETMTGKLPVEVLRPSWLLFDAHRQSVRRTRLYQRIFSFLITVVALLLAAPVMVLIALLIKLDSRGAVFYKQERLGHLGRSFVLYKFRTMRKGAEAETGAVWTQENDARVTRVGRVLRKWRLDELPQFINVARGQMNLVGPRPERPVFVEQLRKQIPFYDARHAVRPGITGWAQVNYKYANSIEQSLEKLQYDLFYVKHASVGFDLMIAFQTAKVILVGRGAH